MRIHVLKCWPEFFRPMADGVKTFEIRKNDRNYSEGDYLVEREYILAERRYTGMWRTYRVGYCTGARPFLPPGLCAMSLVATDYKETMAILKQLHADGVPYNEAGPERGDHIGAAKGGK
jgi:hypothetical protein